MVGSNARDCQHGRLARQCELCEYEEELDALHMVAQGVKHYWRCRHDAAGGGEMLECPRCRAERVEAERDAERANYARAIAQVTRAEAQLAAARAELNDLRCKLAVEEARTTRQAQVVRQVEAELAETRAIIARAREFAGPYDAPAVVSALALRAILDGEEAP